jgi:peroxiredoxin
MRRGIALAAAVVLAVVMAAEAAPVAPAFRTRLLDTSATLDSRDLLGKRVVVVRFQASWCRPCARETEALSRLAERYRGRGVEVIAFHVQDTAADTRRFMRAHGVTYHVALDPKLTVGNRFGASGTPYTVVIDRKGEMVARLAGASAIGKLPRILDAALVDRPSRKL